MKSDKYPYRWFLSRAGFDKNQGSVFSCFACGGGSTMGYKLAGFDVIGFNEIDLAISQVYIKNHNPKYRYIMPIKNMLNEELPEDLYNLDILDGSPPCSSFSITGSREKYWGKERRFREGQSCQILDSLFFDFILLGKKLQPKIIIAENVEGLILGKAVRYKNRIIKELDQSGYITNIYLLNSSNMGVPQSRKRLFFIAIRKDLSKNLVMNSGFFFKRLLLDLKFTFPKIPFSEISDHSDTSSKLTPRYYKYWSNARMGNSVGRFKTSRKLKLDEPSNTLTTSDSSYHPIYPRRINKKESILISSFPLDYDFLNYNYSFILGMSVPPVMMAHIANRVNIQLLKNI